MSLAEYEDFVYGACHVGGDEDPVAHWRAVSLELNEVFVDPFHDGATLTMSEIATMISGISGGQVRLTSEHLRAWTPRQTLVRVLGNLQNMWGRKGEARKAMAAGERIELLQGKP